MRKKPLIISGLILALFFVLLILNIMGGRTKTAQLEIEVAPSDAVIVLNDKRVRVGKRRVEPGTYTVTVSRDGFDIQTKNIKLQKGSDEYVGFALVSNNPSTANWYNEHPRDQKIAERVSSIDFDEHATENTDPIVGDLPFLGPGLEYRIDYGSTDDQQKVHLTVSFVSPEAKADAVAWFANNNYDINKYVVTYTDLLASEYEGE